MNGYITENDELIRNLTLDLISKFEEILSNRKQPNNRKNEASWHSRTPQLEALVLEKGYVKFTDAEKIGLNNTEWSHVLLN